MSDQFFNACKGLKFSRRILRQELKTFDARIAEIQGYTLAEITSAVNRIGYRTRSGRVWLLGTDFDDAYAFYFDENKEFCFQYQDM